jgi:glycosyltransferase involved in cell wall biosynthesis
LYYIVEKIACFLYQHSDKVVVVTESTRNALVKRGVSQSKIQVIKNGVDLERFRRALPVVGQEEIDELRDKFVVGYLGCFARVHGLETVLEGAVLCRDEPFVFLLVGEGGQKELLQRRAMEAKLSNVRFVGQVPVHEVPSYMARCSAFLVSLIKSDLFKTVLPSKFFEAMAAGRPIILAVEGEAAELVYKANAGLVIAPSDPRALVAAVRRLARDPELCSRLGANGVRYVATQHNCVELAKRYLECLQPSEQICDKGKTLC